MHLKNMRDRVRAELEHIPGWPRPEQSYLRMLYFTSRMHSLGKKAKTEKSARQVLHDCIEFLRPEHPGFEFVFDREFFERPASDSSRAAQA
jgi:hypothetical protein